MAVDLSSWPLGLLVASFTAAAVVVLLAGVRLTALADRLADRTGLGEALMGAVFVGASTSLSGSVTSVTAAWEGYTGLAIGNAFGGIAAQTAFLAVADVFYRKSNLEHAAVSIPNLIYGTVLVALLGLFLAATQGPDIAFLGVHPVSPLLIVAYLYGLHLMRASIREPRWVPRHTPETVEDEPGQESESERRETLGRMVSWFIGLVVVSGLAGFFIGRSGIALSRITGIDDTVVGALFTAVSTSTPELVTAVAAVRRGALTLAVGIILGGNAFDVLFAAGSDVAYREGSIYHAIGHDEIYLASLSVVLTGVLLTGLVFREEHGVFNIGFESVVVLVVYLGGVALMAWG